MPPVGAAVAGIIGGGLTVFGSATLGTIVAGVAKLAAGVGLSYVAKALAGKPEEGALRKNRPSGMEVALRAGDIVPRSFIVGMWATAGQLVYIRSYGDAGKTPNAFLVQVIALSHLPVTELAKVFVDGAEVSYTPGGGQSGRGQAIPEYTRDGREHLWIRFHDGTQTSADSFLTSTFNSGPRQWSTANVGRGVAYAVVTSRWNPKLFAHAPELRFQIRGIPLYDITKDTTAGGSGTQRWDQPATWGFSRNPAVILYNLFRGIRYDGEWVYGLQTVSAAQLPFSSWAAAINECDALVTNKDGSTSPQFQAGGEISFATEPGDEIEELLKACNGMIADAGGVYKIKVSAATAAIGSFTDDVLMLGDEHGFTPFPSLGDTVNGIAATYVSPEEGWIEKAAPPRVHAGYVAEDGGRRSVADVAYRRVADKRQVQRLTKAALLEARRFRSHTIVLPPEAFAWEPLDYVAWTSARNGYSAKLFRIDGIVDRDNLDQVATLTEVDPSDYDWTAASDELDTTDGPIDIERPPAQAVQSFTASGTSSLGDDGRAIAAIRVNWDAAVDDVDRVKFEVRRAAGAKPVVCRDETLFVESGAYDISKNINGATAYEVRAIFQDVEGRRDFTWSNWIAVTTPDVRIGLDQLATSLQTLIEAGAAAGKVTFEQVLPAPSGFQTLFRITVYGTGPNPVPAGMYLFVDSGGEPGVIFDVTRFAVGTIANRQFPFVLEGGVLKLKRGNIQTLQAGQIDATSIVVEKFKAGSVTVDAIKGGSITQVIKGSWTGNKVDPLLVKVPTGKIGGRVQIVANFSYGLGRGQGIACVLQKKKGSGWVSLGGAGYYASNAANAAFSGLSGQIIGFDEVASGTAEYRLHRTFGTTLNKSGSQIIAVWYKK